MSFGLDLKNEFDRLCGTTTGRIGEVVLFRNLINAFKNLRGTYRIKEIHGNRYQVMFNAKPRVPFYWISSTNACCELGDILFVVTDGRIVRLSVMQNKYDRKMTRFGDKFEAQVDQLYLLKVRPEFSYNGRSSHMLENAWMPSIGNYGVFRNTAHSYEMGYYSADCLSSPTTMCPSPKSRRKIKLRLIRSHSRYHGDMQRNYCVGIKEFGDSLIRMEIGQPYTIAEAIRELNNEEIADAIRKIELIRNNNSIFDKQERFVMNPERPVISARSILIIESGIENVAGNKIS